MSLFTDSKNQTGVKRDLQNQLKSCRNFYSLQIKQAFISDLKSDITERFGGSKTVSKEDFVKFLNERYTRDLLKLSTKKKAKGVKKNTNKEISKYNKFIKFAIPVLKKEFSDFEQNDLMRQAASVWRKLGTENKQESLDENTFNISQYITSNKLKITPSPKKEKK